jgi:hypothetical protein
MSAPRHTGVNYRRLAPIKKKYDLDNFFGLDQNITLNRVNPKPIEQRNEKETLYPKAAC